MPLKIGVRGTNTVNIQLWGAAEEVLTFAPQFPLELPPIKAFEILIGNLHLLRVIEPAKLVNGVTVTWRGPDGAVRGPGLVAEVDDKEPGERWVCIEEQGRQIFVSEASIVDIDMTSFFITQIVTAIAMLLNQDMDGLRNVSEVLRYLVDNFGDTKDS